ncbi:MAG: nuclear transport factor 2 family protein [Terriglobia bacterium]
MRDNEDARAGQEQVLKANEAFYKALQLKDWAKLESVWLHEDWVQFLHQDMPRATGWKDVVSALALLFRGVTHLSISSGAPEARVLGDTAWVTVYEQITTDVEGDFVTTRELSTNIFARSGGRWKMVHRHTSQMGDAQIVEVSRAVQ